MSVSAIHTVIVAVARRVEARDESSDQRTRQQIPFQPSNHVIVGWCSSMGLCLHCQQTEIIATRFACHSGATCDWNWRACCAQPNSATEKRNQIASVLAEVKRSGI